jgi:hypothetical protein
MNFKIRKMKNVLIMLFFVALGNMLNAQDDWKLPMVNGKIQFEFNSKKIDTGGKDLCELYFSTNTSQELMKKLTAAMVNGKVKFWTASTFTIFPQLFGADASASNPQSYMVKCNPKSADTLIGSLTMSLTQVKTIRASRGGNVKALFRIIIKDNEYNIKFRGFEYSYYKTGSMLKPGEMVVVDLEEEYNEANAKKADKEYWADIKMMINLFHSTLEEVLGGQASDFNFDD